MMDRVVPDVKEVQVAPHQPYYIENPATPNLHDLNWWKITCDSTAEQAMSDSIDEFNKMYMGNFNVTDEQHDQLITGTNGTKYSSSSKIDEPWFAPAGFSKDSNIGTVSNSCTMPKVDLDYIKNAYKTLTCVSTEG
jgi:hypothetical protein